MCDNKLISDHFSLREFTESATAKKYGIANQPPPEAVENLIRLCTNTLEPLREALGLPVIITSGYRCKALNTVLAHSSDRSQHMVGQAADFCIGQGQVSGSKFKVQSHRKLLIKAFHQILQDPNIDFDQLILYPNFIHVSYVGPGANRHSILIGQKDGKLAYGRISLSNALKIV